MQIRSLLHVTLIALITASAQDPSAKDFDLRWRGKAGDVLRLRLSMSQTFENSMVPQAVESETTFVFHQRVKSVSPEGIGTMELDYEAVRMRLTGPMSTSYDSTLEGDAAGQNDSEMAALFGPLLAASIELEIEPSGRIRELRGLEQALQDAFDNLENDQMREAFKQMFGEESLRRMVELQVFPDKPVAVGDTWQRDMDMKVPMLGTMRFDFDNEFRGVERHNGTDCARVDVGGTIELDSSGADFPVPMEASMADSDVSGTMFFDLENGFLVESEMTNALDLEMSFEPGGESEEVGIRMSIETEQRMLRIAEDAPFFE